MTSTDDRGPADLDEFAIRRGSVRSAGEQAERLSELAAELVRLAPEAEATREAMQQALDAAKEVVAQLQLDLMNLEAFATGRARKLNGKWEIDEELQMERLTDVRGILEHEDFGRSA